MNIKRPKNSIHLISVIMLVFTFITQTNAADLYVRIPDTCNEETSIYFYDKEENENLTQSFSYEEIETHENYSFTTFSGNIKIYNGPFDNPNEILVDTTFSNTNSYTQNLEFSQPYLVFIEIEGYPKYEKILLKETCESEPIKPQENPNTNTTDEETPEEPQEEEALQPEDQNPPTETETAPPITQNNNNNNPEPQTSTTEEEVIVQNPDHSMGKTIGIILLGIISLITIVLLTMHLINKKKKHESDKNPIQNTTTHTSNNNTINKKSESNPHPEVLTTYKDTYDKIKEYINTYKESYSKDQIYRALEQADIPRDIIDKVFDDIY